MGWVVSNYLNADAVPVPMGNENFTAALTDVRFVTVNGKPQLIVGDNQGGTKKIDANLVSGTSLRVLNWRQIAIPE